MREISLLKKGKWFFGLGTVLGYGVGIRRRVSSGRVMVIFSNRNLDYDRFRCRHRRPLFQAFLIILNLNVNLCFTKKLKCRK